MLIINHRVNTVTELQEIPSDNGVEIDLRAYKDKIILNHEPFSDGEDFDFFLENYNHKFLILNVKEAGIEKSIEKKLKLRGITDYFYLDLNYSSIHEFVSNFEKKFALRLSEYEGVENILKMYSKADWIWVDCFNSLFQETDIYYLLREKNFKICIASPDLLNRFEEIEIYINYFKKINFVPDAVCVKKRYEYLWNKLL